MKRMTKAQACRIAFAATAALAFTVATSATFPLCAAELAHRWSFNGNFADSVGSADAVKCGTYVSLYGGKVHMGYGTCERGTGYIDLGTNMLDTAAATLEIWARHDGVKNWSRVFDYGADNTHYFALCWTYGTNYGRDRAGMKNPGEIAVDDTMAPYEIGTDYYIAVTFEQQGEATLVKWQRRDAKTGGLQKSGTMTMPDGIQKIADPVLYLGHSQYTADKDALAAYDEVRIWRGALTDAQLAASAAAGPDATIADSAGEPQFTAAEEGETPSPADERPAGLVKMMTFNVRYCYDETGTINPDRTAARIVAENPDFCCINEVRDTEAHPEATLLAKFTGMHKSFGGNLLLSKEEPISVQTYDLPSTNYSRSITVCEFSKFCVAVTHLDVNSSERNAQAANAAAILVISNAFQRCTKPVLLGGDWNTRPTWDNMKLMQGFMTVLSPMTGRGTYHGSGDGSNAYFIDYIAVDTAHKDDFILHDAYVVEDRTTSDHAPVCIEFYRRAKSGEVSEWVNESATTTGLTGTWSTNVTYDAKTLKAEIKDAVFTPTTASNGRTVDLTFTAAMSLPEENQPDPDARTQAAVRLGTNGCLQVWTSGNARPPAWIDVAADGVAPTNGIEYTLHLAIDYRARTYSVEVLGGAARTQLAATAAGAANGIPSGTADFPLAVRASRVSCVEFSGETTFTSLLGEWAGKLRGFLFTAF